MIISRQVLSGALVLLVIGGLSVYKFLKHPVSPPAAINMHLEGRIRGAASAPVKIVEYTDFECPACAAANTMIDTLFKTYDGKISLEHRHFPLPRHTHARRASVFVECAADQGQFWPMHDVVFRSQKSWAEMVSVDAYFSELAVSLGINGARLSVCVNGADAQDRVKKDVEAGKALAVNSTPTFFVNGQRVIGGGFLVQEVEKILGKK